MRYIDKIIIHCSATKEGVDITASDIKIWHIDRGFSDIGYHYVIKLDGTIEKGRHDSRIGAHCRGENTKSIGICYVGGLDSNNKPKDTRTQAQNVALKALIFILKQDYPNAKIKGHNDYANKACHSFKIYRNSFT